MERNIVQEREVEFEMPAGKTYRNAHEVARNGV